MTTGCQWEVWSHTGRVHWIVNWKEVTGIDSRNEKEAELWYKLLSLQSNRTLESNLFTWIFY